jgi:hypothetical protein
MKKLMVWKKYSINMTYKEFSLTIPALVEKCREVIVRSVEESTERQRYIIEVQQSTLKTNHLTCFILLTQIQSGNCSLPASSAICFLFR